MAAPPAKGNTEQSEEGDLPQLPVSPKPDDEQSRSQSPTQLQLTCGRSTRQWRSWGPMSW
uniref:AT-rich interaction domain 5A n=1 Tax=Mus musculus TaxID=10090 RepID=J3KMU9_MOUSE